ncbi:major facilitator superfamily protein [Purpureocillium lavendulum]|uniref:Major facilitator superfamily protein n=1 Tax=Purpureocillium lavendulum TaxID=1247861 RepID=A0AB34G559_9HYPO|nr:major facilitator superfamily protein [Purpureocillium lavendulum]
MAAPPLHRDSDAAVRDPIPGNSKTHVRRGGHGGGGDGGTTDSSRSRSRSNHFSLRGVDEWSSLLRAEPRRPLLTHVNADTTWLVQLPWPAAATTRPPRGRSHFNILIDPWLAGPQSDVASWFSTQWHVVPSGVATIAELSRLLRHVEARASAGGDRAPVVAPATAADADADAVGEPCFIDAVVVSHEFTDHCHRATLEELPPSTPVFASDVAADLIRSWGHFDGVVTIPALGPDVPWKRLTEVGRLPSWLAVGRVITPGNALYYHSAILIAFDLDDRSAPAAAAAPPPPPGDRDAAASGEAIVYSPHGIAAEDLVGVPAASGLRTLALLHGLHDVRIWLTKQLNLGALNGLRAVAASGARYWVATHDEVKTGGGVIAPFLRRTAYSLREAVEHEEARMDPAPDYTFAELGSGDGLVLV